jgi:hypothetical protein
VNGEDSGVLAVLVQPEMEQLARSVSEYSAIYGEPISKNDQAGDVNWQRREPRIH